MNGYVAVEVRRCLRHLAPFMIIGTLVSIAVGATGIDASIVYIGLMLLVVVPAGWLVPLAVRTPEIPCDWWTFAVSTGYGRRDIVNARFLGTVLLPSVIVGIASLLVFAVSDSTDLPMMVLTPFAASLMLSSASALSHFASGPGLRSVAMACYTLTLIGFVLILMGYNRVDTGDHMLLSVSMVLAAIMFVADYVTSLRGFAGKDLRGGTMSLLAFDLRRLVAYLVLPVLAAAVSLTGIGEVSIIFPMIGTALASYGLFAGDKACGWPAFVLTSGISRRSIVRDRFLALLIYAIPLAVVPALCGMATADGGAGIALAGLGVGTYLAGTGYACCANFSTGDDVSLLHGMLGQFVYLACGVVVIVVTNVMLPADGGWPLVSAGACVALGTVALACAYIASQSRFSALDL